MLKDVSYPFVGGEGSAGALGVSPKRAVYGDRTVVQAFIVKMSNYFPSYFFIEKKRKKKKKKKKNTRNFISSGRFLLFFYI